MEIGHDVFEECVVGLGASSAPADLVLEGGLLVRRGSLHGGVLSDALVR